MYYVRRMAGGCVLQRFAKGEWAKSIVARTTF